MIGFLITPIGRAITVAAAFVIAIGIAWAGFGTHYYNKGWRAAMGAVAAQNQKAIKESDDVKKEVQDCYASGGNWDITDAYCLRGK